jgi:hypothetical protein
VVPERARQQTGLQRAGLNPSHSPSVSRALAGIEEEPRCSGVSIRERTDSPTRDRVHAMLVDYLALTKPRTRIHAAGRTWTAPSAAAYTRNSA